VVLQYKNGKLVETYNVWVLLDGNFIDRYFTYTEFIKEDSDDNSPKGMLERLVDEDEDEDEDEDVKIG